jgi:hypothetical protein
MMPGGAGSWRPLNPTAEGQQEIVGEGTTRRRIATTERMAEVTGGLHRDDEGMMENGNTVRRRSIEKSQPMCQSILPPNMGTSGIVRHEGIDKNKNRLLLQRQHQEVVNRSLLLGIGIGPLLLLQQRSNTILLPYRDGHTPLTLVSHPSQALLHGAGKNDEGMSLNLLLPPPQLLLLLPPPIGDVGQVAETEVACGNGRQYRQFAVQNESNRHHHEGVFLQNHPRRRNKDKHAVATSAHGAADHRHEDGSM